jgi:hypothetical protein
MWCRLRKRDAKRYMALCLERERAAPKESRKMTTGFNGGSAKIYQFPARVRPALGGHRDEAKRSENLTATNLTSSRVAKTAFGSAWYHEEAVQDAERASKN